MTPLGAFALIALLSAVGCGEDDASAPLPTTGSSAGAGGAAGATAGAGGMMSAPVQCGATQCRAPSSPFAAFANLGIPLPQPAACCVDEAQAICGVKPSETATTCEPPAKADMRCPPLDLTALRNLAGGAVPVPQRINGCCIDNMCGIDGTLLSRGCVENASAKAQLGAIPLVGSMLPVPAARACDAPPLETDDAGVDDDAGL